MRTRPGGNEGVAIIAYILDAWLLRIRRFRERRHSIPLIFGSEILAEKCFEKYRFPGTFWRNTSISLQRLCKASKCIKEFIACFEALRH